MRQSTVARQIAQLAVNPENRSWPGLRRMSDAVFRSARQQAVDLQALFSGGASMIPSPLLRFPWCQHRPWSSVRPHSKDFCPHFLGPSRWRRETPWSFPAGSVARVDVADSGAGIVQHAVAQSQFDHLPVWLCLTEQNVVN
jgi:hypothetical protein